MADTIKLMVDHAYIPQNAKDRAAPMYRGRGTGPDGASYLFEAPKADIIRLREVLDQKGPYAKVEVEVPRQLLLTRGSKSLRE